MSVRTQSLPRPSVKNSCGATNRQVGGRDLDVGAFVQHVNADAGAAQVGREVVGKVHHEDIAVTADVNTDVVHVSKQVGQVAVVLYLGRQGAFGVVEQRETAHEPREILGVHPAPPLQRS